MKEYTAAQCVLQSWNWRFQLFVAERNGMHGTEDKPNFILIFVITFSEREKTLRSYKCISIFLEKKCPRNALAGQAHVYGMFASTRQLS